MKREKTLHRKSLARKGLTERKHHKSDLLHEESAEVSGNAYKSILSVRSGRGAFESDIVESDNQIQSTHLTSQEEI